MPYPQTKEGIERNRKAQAEWYQRNRAQAIEDRKARRREMREWLNLQKCGEKCSRCGESDPVVLDYHHRDGKDKLIELGNVISKGWGKKRILEEIAKCDIVCANCHRRIHSGE